MSLLDNSKVKSEQNNLINKLNKEMLDEEEKRPVSDQCFGDASNIANQIMVQMDQRDLKSHEVNNMSASRFNQKQGPQMELCLVDQNSSDKSKGKYGNLDEFSPQARYD